MDRKQMCVANVQYKKPTPGEAKRTRSLMKYLTYRDGRDGYTRQARGKERWLDRGMGGSVAEIARRCEGYSSQHVLLFSLVMNPNPDLVAMIPRPQREEFVRELTERTMDSFFDARGIENGVEWSAVMHHRLTDDPQSPGLHNPHTHIVLPGTYYDEDAGERLPLYFSRNKAVNHIGLLHEVTQTEMAELMERYVGRNWEERYDELEAAREQQREVVVEAPHADLPEIGAVWSSARRTDEQTTAAGVYGFFQDDLDHPDARVLRFRSLIAGLPHDEAELLSVYLAELLKGDMPTWNEEVERLKAMSRQERAQFVETIQRAAPEPPERTIDLEW
jgi:hypothetical protein